MFLTMSVYSVAWGDRSCEEWDTGDSVPVTCAFSALVTVCFVDFLFLERHHRSSRHHKYDKYNDRHCVDRKYPFTEEIGGKD